MKIATWNVNSVRTRLSRLLAWLERRQPDVLCLRETKVEDEGFPRAEVEGLGDQAIASANGPTTASPSSPASRGRACSARYLATGGSPSTDCS